MIEIKKTISKDFEFLVKSESGKILLRSIPFKDEQTISKTLQGLSKTVSPARRFERKTNFNGQFLFELKNEKGEIIGSSGFYSSEAGMENGIKNLNNRLVHKNPTK